MGVVRDAIEGALGIGGTDVFVPAEAPALSINERSGRKRAIVLRGRMLPFRRPEWSGTQRSEVTYYPGNPEGTMQIFGPSADATTLTGVWHERYISASGLEVKGFDFPSSVEDLVKIFDEFRKSGSVIDVQWAFVKRRGILKRFVFMPDRVEDMEWRAEFEWFSDGTRAPLVLGIPFDLNKITENMNALSDLAAFDPIDTLQAFEATIFQAIADIQSQVNELVSKAQVLANALTLPARVTQGIRAAATEISFQIGELLQMTAEGGYTLAQTTDQLSPVFLMEVFKRDMTFFASNLREAVLNAATNLESRAEPTPVRTVIMDQSGSLRVVAQREYGNADAWTVIADANGFEGPRVEPGTEILIPPAGSGSTGVT